MDNIKVNWISFKDSLNKNLKEFRFEKLMNELPDKSWTNFYMRDLFPKIACDLNLHYNLQEYLTVDAIFYNKEVKTNTGWEIPLVFIESENAINSLSPSKNDNSELYKLCCLNAPLKVIFTYRDIWNKDQKRKYVHDDWQDIINAFVKGNRLIGQLVIIVAQQSNKSILFHPFLFDENGTLNEEEIIEVNRE